MDEEGDLGVTPLAGHLNLQPSKFQRVASAPSSPLSKRPKMPPRLLLKSNKVDRPAPKSPRRSNSTSDLTRSTSGRVRRNTLTSSAKFPTAILGQDELQSFRRYALCFALVEFDIDAGPVLDSVFPLPCPFSPTEMSDIAFSSFPDTSSTSASNSTTLTFNWRIPRDPNRTAACPESPFLYGYSSFLQQRNEAYKRNYLQRSFVLVTHRPDLHGLFMRVADVLGTLHTKSDNELAVLLEVACSNIAHWPVLQPGAMVELNLMGNLITVDVPLRGQAQAHDALSAASPRIPRHAILASVPIAPLSLLFQDSLSSLWLLWELCVLSEPILIYAPSDIQTSTQIATWLQALAKPLIGCTDYRPFYNVHTSDFSSIINSASPRKGLIIGCTNPLLFSGCRHWPHIYRCFSRSFPDGGVFGTTSSVKSSASFKGARDATRSGLFSDRKRVVKRDEEVLDAVQALVKAGDFLSADALLIRHFSSQSEKLVVPLNRYFASLNRSALDSFAKPTPLQPFSAQDFLLHLNEHDTPLAFRRSKLPGSTSINAAYARSFYKRFMTSPAFAFWLQTRVENTDEVATRRFLSNLQELDVEEFFRSKSTNQVSRLLGDIEQAISDIDTDAPQISPNRPERKVALQKQAERLKQLQGSESDLDSLETPTEAGYSSADHWS